MAVGGNLLEVDVGVIDTLENSKDTFKTAPTPTLASESTPAHVTPNQVTPPAPQAVTPASPQVSTPPVIQAKPSTGNTSPIVSGERGETRVN